MDQRKESSNNKSSEEWHCNHVKFNRARLTVCGISYEIRWQTLMKYPRTRLGGLAISFYKNAPYDELRTFCDDYDQKAGHFFFERDPTAFVAILNYHITGHLHIPRSKCVKSFEDEVTYWGIPFDIEPCCDAYYCDQWEHTEAIKKADQLECTLKKQERKSIDTKKWETYLKKLWNLFEHPATSIAAKIVSLVSNLTVILSTIVLCLNTHPDLQHILPNGEKGDNPYLVRIELVCIIWFTIEYIARLISCPSKKQFLKGGLNAIDLLAILPYYMQLIFEKALGRVDTNFINIRRFIQIMRFIRIARIFKLARHSTGLQVLGYTMIESSQELSLLALLLMMGVTLFATLVYYAEEHVPGTKFKSIIEGFWWATVSMTTVGYGDMNPETTIGKIIGSCCCVCGILFIALPIPTIVGNFSKYYSEHQNKQKIKKYKMDRTRKVSHFRSWTSAIRPSMDDV